jgi:hypothetical protein
MMLLEYSSYLDALIFKLEEQIENRRFTYDYRKYAYVTTHDLNKVALPAFDDIDESSVTLRLAIETKMGVDAQINTLEEMLIEEEASYSSGACVDAQPPDVEYQFVIDNSEVKAKEWEEYRATITNVGTQVRIEDQESLLGQIEP